MVERLFPILEAHGDRPVICVGDISITASALSRRCLAFQRWMTTQGLAPKDTIGVWTQPSLESVVALVASAAAGLVVVPLNPQSGTLELSHIAQDAQLRITVAANPEAVQGRLPGATVCAAAAAAPAPAATPPGSEVASLGGRCVDDQALLVLYTSGTTGLPKGAVLSARNVAANLDALAVAWRWTAADTVIHSLPLFHVHGLVLGLFGTLRVGGLMHWLPRFSPSATAEALAQGRTILFAVPTMYHRLADAAQADARVASGLSNARLLVSGSAPLPLRIHQRLRALTGQTVRERYGLTETLINCAVRSDDPPEEGRVGLPLGGVELRVVDDERRPLPVSDDSSVGEVAVRGPHVFLGYLNRPEATAASVDAQGWFYTGDLATQRADGSIRLIGRRSTDLIKSGGYKIGAGEVEGALLEHPKIREAAVVGRPDAELGERVVAFVVADEELDSQALQDFVAQQLSPHKRPREIHCVEQLPRNAMGKVLKATL